MAEDFLLVHDYRNLKGSITVRACGLTVLCSFKLRILCAYPHFLLALRSWASAIYSTHYSFLDAGRRNPGVLGGLE